MFLLSKTAAAVASLAAKHTTRYAIDGVLVEDLGANVRAVATDGHCLGIYEAPAADLAEYPADVIPADSPNGATRSIVPAKTFAEALKKASKAAPRFKPILGRLAVQCSDAETTFGHTNIDTKQSQRVRNIEGSFPPYADVVPKGAPVFACAFNPELVGRVLKAAAEACDAETPGVVLEFFGTKKPMKITARNSEGESFTGVVMPVNSDRLPQAGADVLPALEKLAEETWQAFRKDGADAINARELADMLLRQFRPELAGAIIDPEDWRRRRDAREAEEREKIRRAEFMRAHAGELRTLRDWAEEAAKGIKWRSRLDAYHARKNAAAVAA